MNKLWDKITDKDIKKAIELFNRTKEKHPKPRNTFLIFNNKIYPAKHIRGLAYFIANKKEISKNDYNGGQETATFFKKLGFTVQYKKETLQPKTDKIISSKDLKVEKSEEKKVSKKLNVVSQKNALQKLFQKHFGHIETEKHFEWLKTPNHNYLPKEYNSIVKALSEYRNQNGFQKSNYQLLCDIVLDDHKLIIEYDENQHFTKARKITLENYPASIQLSYSKEAWINACEKINAKDNSPIDRDEKRAYYDTVRDFETYKHGYKLVRIKHGDFDWESPDSELKLKELINNKFIDLTTHKIARIVVSEKQYDSKGLNENRLRKFIIDRFIKKVYSKKYFEFVITPGGFLNFLFPKEFQEVNKIIAEKDPSIFYPAASKVIQDFFNKMERESFQKLKKIADYFTIGIDGSNTTNHQTIELVAVFDLKKEKVIRWTGKFYPNKEQESKLIKINDLNTHFIELNNQKIVILGCHDLNVYSPRGQAKAGILKKKLANKFKKTCKDYKPDIILQHPHTTDTPNIWNLAWCSLLKELPYVQHFASGICYCKYDKKAVRGDLNKVLDKTKKGDVLDFK